MAAGLHGQELAAWLEHAEDAVFEREHAEQRAKSARDMAHLRIQSEQAPMLAKVAKLEKLRQQYRENDRGLSR